MFEVCLATRFEVWFHLLVNPHLDTISYYSWLTRNHQHTVGWLPSCPSPPSRTLKPSLLPVHHRRRARNPDPASTSELRARFLSRPLPQREIHCAAASRRPAECIGVKRSLMIWQKRPSTETKEAYDTLTYLRSAERMRWCQKRPINVEKEAYSQ